MLVITLQHKNNIVKKENISQNILTSVPLRAKHYQMLNFLHLRPVRPKLNVIVLVKKYIICVITGDNG